MAKRRVDGRVDYGYAYVAYRRFENGPRFMIVLDYKYGVGFHRPLEE
jgi:hypothetical protein